MIHLELTNAVDRYPRPDFIIDVKVCAMVTADGDWKARWNADKTVLENHTLTKNSASMRAVMLLSVMPFSLLFWAVLVVLALRRRDFCAL